MAERIELKVPDLGDFADVEIIEVLVSPGDVVAVEDGLVTLETDKASMDVPASHAGKVISVDVAVGDTVSTGDVVVTIEATEAVEAAQAEETGEDWSVRTQRMTPEEIQAATSAAVQGDATHSAQLVVIGSGPGGYTAAFRAADLGLDVILVEKDPYLGGVCLNVGCIPSKALLHAAKVIDDAAAMADHGVVFGPPKIEADKLVDWKNSVVGRLTGGLAQLAKQRKVRLITAYAKFQSANRLELDNGETIAFEKCVIAAGSEPFMLPDLPEDPRIVDSTGALEVHPLPKSLLVVGGGIIGLEMACVYAALGVEVSVVELMDSLMPGTDKDLLRPFLKVVKPRYEKIMVSTRVTGLRVTEAGIEVSFEGKDAPETGIYDRVLVAIGRRANGDKLDAAKAGVKVDERGIIAVDKQMRTNVPHIFAIGDLAGGPMLAHKATHEAKVAAEVAAGEKSYFDARAIPSVAYTDPEVAWVGLTETEAKEKGIDYGVAKIPWAASGRALSLGRDEGFTKLLFDKKTDRVLGGAIVGPTAGDLIAEIGLAIEMGADASDIGLTVHPHPTLSETVAFAAEGYEGTITDLYMPKKK
ncbi:MAG: dihydrolipoyl dehydrogenase [Gammaproteobacteria bacterium]|nr:dihydrolipoyl dehydrogenase [Gammaproteobacteria bacterium]MDH3906120.1 dihydrolipoyl dehydrogenase [Gammaproteobacteria bacterium]MDH4005084.1 dihydrolipoyl dehydrogenase [Gammaproteobacteria bacterium]NCF58893.1 dihydrolipoyl dehydrogenase [Gammaproteobacteria bacterium]